MSEMLKCSIHRCTVTKIRIRYFSAKTIVALLLVWRTNIRPNPHQAIKKLRWSEFATDTSVPRWKRIEKLSSLRTSHQSRKSF